jgi:hypothetical protein
VVRLPWQPVSPLLVLIPGAVLTVADVKAGHQAQVASSLELDNSLVQRLQLNGRADNGSMSLVQ